MFFDKIVNDKIILIFQTQDITRDVRELSFIIFLIWLRISGYCLDVIQVLHLNKELEILANGLFQKSQ